MGGSSWSCCFVNWAGRSRYVKSVGACGIGREIEAFGIIRGADACHPVLRQRTSALATLSNRIPAIDRGDTDYQWFADLTQEGVYFVTRLKDNADYAAVEERELPQRKGLQRDQVIFFTSLHTRE